jgi:hypothetical protein
MRVAEKEARSSALVVMDQISSPRPFVGLGGEF